MNKMVNGVLTPMTDAEIAQFQASDPSDSEKTAQKWIGVRAKRNILLADCDWRAFSDLTLADEWKTYRQALRDVPTQSDPDNITWPTKPN